MKRQFAVAISLVTLACSVHAANGDVWRDFVSAQTEGSRDALLHTISTCHGQEYHEVCNPDESSKAKLIAMVSAGDIYAVDVGYAIVGAKIWDGGDLEDLYGSIGSLLDKGQAQIFISEANHHGISDAAIKKIACSLPDSAVDNFTEQLKIINSRLVSVNSTRESSSAKRAQLSTVRALKECASHIEG